MADYMIGDLVFLIDRKIFGVIKSIDKKEVCLVIGKEFKGKMSILKEEVILREILEKKAAILSHSAFYIDNIDSRILDLLFYVNIYFQYQELREKTQSSKEVRAIVK